jgi:hypothetical protein
MMLKSILRGVAALAVLLALTQADAFAEDDRRPLNMLVNLLKGAKDKAREIDRDAMRAFERAPREGSCSERRGRIQAMLPEALRFARLARDIGKKNHEAKMKAGNLATLDLGGGRTAHYRRKGRRYAEVVLDQERRQAVVNFNGTRPRVKTDLTTDVLGFIGVETRYYRWAAELVAQVVRERPGLEVVATGHSLGGGLAIYAVLKNPGVKGFAFNPAGLALLTWAGASAAERERTSAAVTVVSIRNARHIEPVTAISLAGRSVLPGRILVLEVDEGNVGSLHASRTVVAALEQVAATDAAGEICHGDLGILAE